MSLRNPDWDNKWLTTFGTVQHRNITGDPRQYQRSAVLVEDGFEIKISANSAADVATFESAYISSIGTAITYTDFEGTVWSGYWVPDSYICKRGKAGCYYEINIRFSGTHS